MRGLVSVPAATPPELEIYAKALLNHAATGRLLSEIREEGRLPDRVKRLLTTKAAVGAGNTGDGDFGGVLNDWSAVRARFFERLGTSSLFFRLLANGMRRVPPQTGVAVVTANATAWIVGEGKPAPLSRLSLRGSAIPEQKACALIVVSGAVASSATPEAQGVISGSLRKAVGDVVDDAFLASITDTGTPGFSGASGTDAAAMRTDLGKLLGAVNTRGGGRLVWAMSPDVANGAALLDDRGAMTPLGGELLAVPAMVSDALPNGTIYLIDGHAIAATAGDIEIRASGQANIEMADDPTNDSATPTESTMVSLWQTNSVSLKALVNFGAERLEANALAFVDDVQWARGPEA